MINLSIAPIFAFNALFLMTIITFVYFCIFFFIFYVISWAVTSFIRGLTGKPL